MKKSVVSLFAGILALAVIQNTKADVIADWTFQTAASTTGVAGTAASRSGMSADIGSGTASGVHASASTVWSLPGGNGSSASLSSDHWASGDYYQFSVSTIGFSGITIAYDQTGSATGPKDFSFQYSTDGSAFTTFATYVVLTNSVSANNSGSGFVTTAWNATTAQSAFTQSIDLSSISALDNIASAYFRIIVVSSLSETGGAIGTGGTDRVDNFIVSAAPVPEPSTIALAGIGGVAALLALRRRK